MKLRTLTSGIFSALLACMAAGGCDKPTEPPKPILTTGRTAMAITVTSEALTADEPIPVENTEDGEDLSPQVSWSQVPEGCREFALIVDDPDAPTPDPWVHWVIYKIPNKTRELTANIPPSGKIAKPAGALQGENSWGEIGYRGPAPPKGGGMHHYHFKLYALDAELDLPAGLTKPDLLDAIDGHVLAEGELIGTYER